MIFDFTTIEVSTMDQWYLYCLKIDSIFPYLQTYWTCQTKFIIVNIMLVWAIQNRLTHISYEANRPKHIFTGKNSERNWKNHNLPRIFQFIHQNLAKQLQNFYLIWAAFTFPLAESEKCIWPTNNFIRRPGFFVPVRSSLVAKTYR